MSQEVEYEESCGNVFEDLGLSNPEERLAKAELAFEISNIIKEKKLTQVKVAALLGISQPSVSTLLHGSLRSFSLERLLRFLNDLGQDVKIFITPSASSSKGFTSIGSSTKRRPSKRRPSTRRVATLEK